MPLDFDATAWSAGLLGLFSIFAAIGALRKPGIWRTVIDEIDLSPALQVLCGLVELFIGAVIYLINPWDPGDILSCVTKGIGGLMMIEALAVTGFPDLYFHVWLKNLAAAHRVWAAVTLMFGTALFFGGFLRLA